MLRCWTVDHPTDLLYDATLVRRSSATWVVEVKRSTAPTLSRGFDQAATDMGATRKLLVAPVASPCPLREGIEGIEGMDPLSATAWAAAQG